MNPLPSKTKLRAGWLSRAAIATAAVVLAGCATPQMEAQWRDPQLASRAMQGKSVLVVCRGLDLTLERICEDQLAADAQAAGVRVMRAEVAREAPADAAAATELLLRAARAVRADAVLATTLERGVPLASSGGTVGVGVGGSSGGWGSRTGGGIGITLPIGGSGGPTLAASSSLTDAVSGRLLWSARARGSGAVNEAGQVGEVSRVTAEALKASGLF